MNSRSHPATEVVFDTGSSGAVWHAERPRNPMLELPLVAPRKGAILKFLCRLPMGSTQRTASIASAPDRIVMKEHTFPEVAKRGGNILFVGVRAYTADYPPQFEAHGGLCWTIDRDPDAAPYGVPGRHATASITDIDEIYAAGLFRSIVLTGVLGFGVNRFSNQARALEACADALEPNGTLILGRTIPRHHPLPHQPSPSSCHRKDLPCPGSSSHPSPCCSPPLFF